MPGTRRRCKARPLCRPSWCTRRGRPRAQRAAGTRSSRPAGLYPASREIGASPERLVPLFPPAGRHSAAPGPYPPIHFKACLPCGGWPAAGQPASRAFGMARPRRPATESIPPGLQSPTRCEHALALFVVGMPFGSNEIEGALHEQLGTCKTSRVRMRITGDGHEGIFHARRHVHVGKDRPGQRDGQAAGRPGPVCRQRVAAGPRRRQAAYAAPSIPCGAARRGDRRSATAGAAPGPERARRPGCGPN